MEAFKHVKIEWQVDPDITLTASFYFYYTLHIRMKYPTIKMLMGMFETKNMYY